MNTLRAEEGSLGGDLALLKNSVRAPNSASRVETRNFPALFFFGQWYARAIAYYKGGPRISLSFEAMTLDRDP